MAARNTVTNLLLFLLLVAFCMGFFLTIHTVDIFRHREEVVVRELKDIRSEIGRVQVALEQLSESGGAVLRPTEGRRGGQAASTSTSEQRPRFHNLQARDPNAQEGDHLVLSANVEVQNLNFILGGPWHIWEYWRWTFDSLGERNLENPDVFEPMLAESWEIS